METVAVSAHSLNQGRMVRAGSFPSVLQSHSLWLTFAVAKVHVNVLDRCTCWQVHLAAVVAALTLPFGGLFCSPNTHMLAACVVPSCNHALSSLLPQLSRCQLMYAQAACPVRMHLLLT